MNNKERVYGLIGCPVKHSLSPVMHNAAFKALGINAHYELFEVEPRDLSSFLNSLKDTDIYGLNVTIPHKEKILDFVRFDQKSNYARQIKAMNTLVRKDEAWLGSNTDVPGFLRHLKENIDPVKKRVAILGAGGAGRAVAYAIASAKAKQIAIFDIDKEKANGVVELIKSLFKNPDIKSVDSIEELDVVNRDILINTTPIGMKESDPCLVREDMLSKNIFVYDVIYNPARTKLLEMAQKVGARTSNGLGMLLYQGMLSFEMWINKPAPQEVMWEALLSQISTK
jgi:shikimate dehydrogenase